MDRAAREQVRVRAGNRCEYCHTPQELEPFFTYRLEHIISKQHGGKDDESNRALACPWCNQHNGPNIAGLDPIDGALTPLFNPREHHWDEHFLFAGPEIVGLTAIGRATVQILNMNEPVRVELRAEMGKDPPK